MTPLSRITRKTKETEVELKLELDGRGDVAMQTGIPFLDHMLHLFAAHGYFDLTRSRPKATCTWTSTIPWKTSASAWAKPFGRPCSSAPGCAASARPGCPWTRPWPR